MGISCLFLCLLEDDVLAKSLAKFLKLDLSLHFLLVLAGPVGFSAFLVFYLYNLNL